MEWIYTLEWYHWFYLSWPIVGLVTYLCMIDFVYWHFVPTKDKVRDVVFYIITGWLPVFFVVVQYLKARRK